MTEPTPEEPTNPTEPDVQQPDEHTIIVTAKGGTVLVFTMRCESCRGCFNLEIEHLPGSRTVKLLCPHCKTTIEYDQQEQRR